MEGLLRVEQGVGKRQAAKLAAIRQQRDGSRVASLLAILEGEARGTSNLMPVILECVESYASIGEICGVLRRVWGEHRESLVF